MQALLARQPIFDRHGDVVAYELLYRSDGENRAGAAPGERGTANVLVNAFSTFGIEQVTGGKRAFINLTRDLLVSDYVRILPAPLVVLEILEDVAPDPEVTAAARSLVAQGYSLALDDFVYAPQYHELLDLVEVVKIDLLAASNGALDAQVRALTPYGRRLLAEKVETREQYAEALALGFDYFQGYFFSQPMIMAARELPCATFAALKSMREVLTAQDVGALEKIINVDLSLSYRLLRLINSAAFGLVQEVSSIRHALTLLGLVAVKQWLSLILLAEVGSEKPVELLRLSLIRAKVLEALISTEDAQRRSQAFTVGLFSTIDAFLDRPLDEALAPLHFPEESMEALLHRRGELGGLLALAIAYERGDWGAVSDEVTRLQLASETVATTYLAALSWAEETVAVSA